MERTWFVPNTDSWAALILPSLLFSGIENSSRTPEGEDHQFRTGTFRRAIIIGVCTREVDIHENSGVLIKGLGTGSGTQTSRLLSRPRGRGLFVVISKGVRFWKALPGKNTGLRELVPAVWNADEVQRYFSRCCWKHLSSLCGAYLQSQFQRTGTEIPATPV